MKTNSHPVVFYDGVCGLCDKSVQFLIKQDKQQNLRYAALQSTLAQNVLGDNINFDSFILFNQGKVYKRSTAAIKAFQLIGGWWKLATIGYIFPTFIRDWVYDFVARNRYKWFGKFDSCKIPTPEQRQLFLDT